MVLFCCALNKVKHFVAFHFFHVFAISITFELLPFLTTLKQCSTISVLFCCALNFKNKKSKTFLLYFMSLRSVLLLNTSLFSQH